MTEPCTPSQFWEPDYDETEHLRGLLARRTEAMTRVLAEKDQQRATIDHLETMMHKWAPLYAVGREVQKRVNRGEVEGSYLNLPGVVKP